MDGEPGHELQVDTGWVLSLEPDDTGVRRRKKAFVFTPNVSRYRSRRAHPLATTGALRAVLRVPRKLRCALLERGIVAGQKAERFKGQDVQLTLQMLEMLLDPEAARG